MQSRAFQIRIKDRLPLNLGFSSFWHYFSPFTDLLRQPKVLPLVYPPLAKSISREPKTDNLSVFCLYYFVNKSFTILLI